MCAFPRGAAPAPAPRSVAPEAPPPLTAPGFGTGPASALGHSEHVAAWEGGSSRLTLLRPPGGAGPLLEHALSGVEPLCVFSPIVGDRQAHDAAERVATALAQHVPAQDFLPVLCRPEHVHARRNFANQVLLSAEGVPELGTTACVGDIALAISTAADGPGSSLLSGATRDLTGLLAPNREDLIRVRQRRLQERVARFGLLLDVMASDGNCLFRAVSRQLYGTPALHELVRHHVAAQLNKDRGTYTPFFSEELGFEQYLLEMAADGTWGDELALRAVADAYGAEVHILTSAGSGCYLLYVPADTEKFFPGGARIFLAYTYPVHYDGLVAERIPESREKQGHGLLAAAKLGKAGYAAKPPGADTFDLDMGCL